MIIILISCSIIIFTFTIAAKFLGRDTFDRLPDFLKDSYSALWSAGAVAGGALVASVIDSLSKYPSTKTGFIAYVMITTLLIMTLIVGTVYLSKLTETPQFAVPNGATSIAINADTDGPVKFYLQNRLFGGNPANIIGHYEIKNGELTGEIDEAELMPATPVGPMTGPLPPPLPLTWMSIHICYLSIQNGNPSQARRPEIPESSNRVEISTTTDIQTIYHIPKFGFKISVKHVDNITPVYLCAFIGGAIPGGMIYY